MVCTAGIAVRALRLLLLALPDDPIGRNLVLIDNLNHDGRGLSLLSFAIVVLVTQLRRGRLLHQLDLVLTLKLCLPATLFSIDQTAALPPQLIGPVR